MWKIEVSGAPSKISRRRLYPYDEDWIEKRAEYYCKLGVSIGWACQIAFAEYADNPKNSHLKVKLQWDPPEYGPPIKKRQKIYDEHGRLVWELPRATSTHSIVRRIAKRMYDKKS